MNRKTALALILVALGTLALFGILARCFGLQRTRDCFEGLFYFAAVIAAVFSVLQYWSNSRREKARWLLDLYQRFYQDPMRKVREALDWAKADFCNEPLKEENSTQLANLDDYLNFFEFVAYLEKLGQISKEDIRHLFQYFLEDLGKEPVSSYISRYGYENLYNLLGTLGYLRARARTNGST